MSIIIIKWRLTIRRSRPGLSELTDFQFHAIILVNSHRSDTLTNPSIVPNPMTTLLSTSTLDRSILLRLARREDYFGYFYYAYATASGRCFASGRSAQE